MKKSKGKPDTENDRVGNDLQVKEADGEESLQETQFERVTLPDRKYMSNREKKLAKKSAKFDEMDLRNYPMSIGGWIATFILLAIPMVNFICGICWFFGVGNKSRTAFIRAYVIVLLIITLVFGLIFGITFVSFMNQVKAQTGAETVNEALYVIAEQVISSLESQGTLDAETAEAARAQFAELFGGVDRDKFPNSTVGSGDHNGNENNGGEFDSPWGDESGWEEEFQ